MFLFAVPIVCVCVCLGPLTDEYAIFCQRWLSNVAALVHLCDAVRRFSCLSALSRSSRMWSMSHCSDCRLSTSMQSSYFCVVAVAEEAKTLVYVLTSGSRTNGAVERNGGLDAAQPAVGIGESGRRGASAAWEGGSKIENERVGGAGRRENGEGVVEGVAPGSPTSEAVLRQMAEAGVNVEV